MSDEVKSQAASFRAKLLVAMMLVVAGLTGTGLYVAQRKVNADIQRDLQRNFQADLVALHSVEELRYAALAERCRALVAKPRIHAALEDNALDLLYPSAKDELRDIMQNEKNPQPDQISGVPHARFYRFLDRTGALLPPPNPADVGLLQPEEEAQLALNGLPHPPQIGYLLRGRETAQETIDEIIALPITSSESNEVIAALVIGFKPLEVAQKNGPDDVRSGIWLNGWLRVNGFLGDGVQAVLLLAPELVDNDTFMEIDEDSVVLV